LMGAMQDDSKSRAIVLAISVLGESLGITTFASGVETSDQLLNVRSEGCNSIQGFYSSEAVPAGELAALFAPGNPTSSITV
jgi:EAL domain-containing protein (putative c-di-GMP-specific phosphodiesterase class I)